MHQYNKGDSPGIAMPCAACLMAHPEMPLPGLVCTICTFHEKAQAGRERFEIAPDIAPQTRTSPSRGRSFEKREHSARSRSPAHGPSIRAYRM